LRPVSAVVFLSWSADLLRATLRPAPVHDLAGRIGMVLLLGACGFAAGMALMAWILRRVRGNGELGTM
jgi:ABC-2 type transport system permease protein